MQNDYFYCHLKNGVEVEGKRGNLLENKLFSILFSKR